MTVHVYHPYRQPDGTNYCQAVNGHCSHLCLPAPQFHANSPKISCACPTGLKLTSDGLMCEEGQYLCWAFVSAFGVGVQRLVGACILVKRIPSSRDINLVLPYIRLRDIWRDINQFYLPLIFVAVSIVYLYKCIKYNHHQPNKITHELRGSKIICSSLAWQMNFN